MTTKSEREARTLTNHIKRCLSDLEAKIKYFHSINGWLPLGYESFTEWWDAELGDIPLATGLRNWAIFKMVEEMPRHAGSGRMRHGSYAYVADVMGVSDATVKSTVQKTRERNHMRITGRSENDMVAIGCMVPNRWRKNIFTLARQKDLNMADLLRGLIADGMQRQYGVDVNASTEGVNSGPRRPRK